ncbi:apolipo protein O-domain-containing protein [Umbelopsis sp. PMI_123]|nr:apolipo protein O-domain-containing protein [Umbelopsis sp. PMI_123]
MISPAIKQSLSTAAAGFALATVVSRPVAYAEDRKQKLNIYDEPEPEIVLVESPSRLEENVAIAQKYVNDTYDEGVEQLHQVQTKLQKFENNVKKTIDETIAPGEHVMPNALYVGVAALAGTIVARNRNIVLRFATSTAFAVGTSYYLMPNTTRNIGNHLDRLERKFPPLYDAHQQLNEAFGDARKQLDDTVAQLTGAASDATSQLSSKAKQLENDISSTASAQTSKLESSAAEAREKFDEVKEKVENMYSTRVKPAVEETLKGDSK